MHNILSMDLYRFRKSKSTYIIYAIFLGFIALAVYSLQLSQKLDLLGEKFESVTSVVDYLTNGNTAIFIIVIFIAIFVNAEFSSGYIKNIMGDVAKKQHYIFSKMVIITIYTTVFVLSNVLISIFAGKAVLKIEEFGDVGKFIAYIGVNYLLNLTLGFIMLWITLLLRNSAASTSIGVVYTLVLGTMIYQLVNLFVNQILKISEFDIREFLVLGNLNIISSASSVADMLRAVIVGIIFAGIAVSGSIYTVKHRDV